MHSNHNHGPTCFYQRFNLYTATESRIDMSGTNTQKHDIDGSLPSHKDRQNSCPPGTSGHQKAQHEAQHKWYAARSSFDVRWYGKRRSGAKCKGAQNARYEFYDGEEGRRRLTRRVQVRRKRKRRREDAPLASCCRASGIKAGFGKRGGSRAALAGRGRFQGIGWGRRGPVDGTHASCWRGSFDS